MSTLRLNELRYCIQIESYGVKIGSLKHLTQGNIQSWLSSHSSKNVILSLDAENIFLQ